MKRLAVWTIILAACTNGRHESSIPSNLEDPSQHISVDDDGYAFEWKSDGPHFNWLDAGSHCDDDDCDSHHYSIDAELTLDPSNAGDFKPTEQVTVSWRYEPGDSGVGSFGCDHADARVVITYYNGSKYTSDPEWFGMEVADGAGCQIQVTRFDSAQHGIIEGSFDAIVVGSYYPASVAPITGAFPARGEFRVIRDN